MVYPFELDSVWTLTDSWNIETACRLILTGYNEDFKRTIEYGLKECKEASPGRDRANALLVIVERFMTIASSSVKAGTIKEYDTPANWIKWAKSKGYSVAHLMPADAKGAKMKAETDTNPSADDWKEQARAIANECFDIDTKNGCRDSLKGYSKRVMELMQERGIKGARGIIDNPATIMREALQADKWWKNKSK